MITVALIFAGLAALLHVYIFVMESLTWTTPRTRAVFGTTAEEAQTTKMLAFNQGFYNLFLAVGVGTFAMRLSFVELYGRLRIPSVLSRALLYVPASVLAALVLPAVVYPNGQGAFVLNNPQIPAAIIAAWVAWQTRNTVLTLAVGMGALWLFKFIGL